MTPMFRKYFVFLSFIILTLPSIAQTQQDTIYSYRTPNPVVVDGNDNDSCWTVAEWHTISVVWLPYYNAPMDEGDFTGRFKLAWDSLYLYVLVEVVDDSLSDDHVNPLDSYWEDDCVEIFIDENRSKGNHLNNYNAFAYHVSTYYDAIDGGTGTSINLKDNLSVVMDTIAEHTYRWEFAIKIYDATFKPNNTEVSRVNLQHNKLMGFSLAYCDNDETKGRENFIGSTFMTASTSNDNYITADYFGTLLLVDPNYIEPTGVEAYQTGNAFIVFPNPVKNELTLRFLENQDENITLEIRDVSGRLVLKMNNVKTNQKINVEGLKNGVYTLRFTSPNIDEKTMFIKSQN